MALNDNLVAYRKFDESSGDASDATGRWNTATNVLTATYVTGKINNGISLNWTNQYFWAADDADFDFGTWAVSISFRCYQDSLSNYRYLINQRNNDSSTWAQFAIFTEPWAATWDRLAFFIYNGSAGQQVSATNSSHTSWSWIHYVFTRSADGTEMKIYKNGALNNTASNLTARNADNNGKFTIGQNIGQWSPRNGDIDEVWVWKTTLTADDVTSLYNWGNGLQYPFSSIKTINWLAKASVKTVNGLAIANVKTFNWLA